MAFEARQKTRDGKPIFRERFSHACLCDIGKIISRKRARRPYFIDKSDHNFTYIVKGNFSSLLELINIIGERGEASVDLFERLVNEQLKTMDKLLFLQSEIERCQAIEKQLIELQQEAKLQSIQEEICQMKRQLKEIQKMFEKQTEEVILSYQNERRHTSEPSSTR